MKFGIIPNINKENIVDVVLRFVKYLENYGFDYFITNEFLNINGKVHPNVKNLNFLNLNHLLQQSDIIVSVGGDGTMLQTAYTVRDTNKPIMGLNLGKLGFLAEFEMNRIDVLLTEIKNGEYIVEERTVLEGKCITCGNKELFAVNDIVIDKGGWPKMVELSIKVDDEYVTTFVADGLILATPTGSTGYSLSTGGPVINPVADVIALSPISPHSLTMRPLVLGSNQKILINVKSQYKFVQVSCDGQRVYELDSPCEISIFKSDKKLKLIHTHSTKYFNVLREKLFWGIDIRKNNK